jgi:D-amino-acid dehydrogenase
MSPSEAAVDVCVVGGGVIGVAITYELASRGCRVALVERELDLGRGCSYGNAGLIVPSHSMPLQNPASLRQGLHWLFQTESPLSIHVRPSRELIRWLAAFTKSCTRGRSERTMQLIRDLGIVSRELHAELALSVLSESTFRRDGCLNVYETDDMLRAGEAEARRITREGLEFRVFRGDDLRAFEPMLNDEVAGAIYFEREAHCDPYAFVQALGSAARRSGADIQLGCEVLSIAVKNLVHVATTTGELRAETLVLATGAWSRFLAHGLQLQLPIEPAKGYHVDLEGGDNKPSAPLAFHGARLTVTPLPGRIRLCGSFELGGLDMRFNERKVRTLLAVGNHYVPTLRGRRVQGVWRGLRPCTPDGLPVVGRIPREPQVVVATGHCMMGLTLAPITARLVAELVVGDRPSFDLTPFSAARFLR